MEKRFVRHDDSVGEIRVSPRMLLHPNRIFQSPLEIIGQQIMNHLNLVREKIKVLPQDSIERGMRYAKLRRTPSC